MPLPAIPYGRRALTGEGKGFEVEITIRTLIISSITMRTTSFFIVIVIPMTVPSIPFVLFTVLVMAGTVGVVVAVATVASVLISFHPFVNSRGCKRKKWWWREGEIRKKSHVLSGKVPPHNYSGSVVSITMPWSCQSCSSGKRKS